MSRERLAAAYEALADAYGQVAHELRANDSAPVRADAPAAGAIPPAPAPAATQGVDTSRCPKHGTIFKPSKNPGWAAYCPERSDDPAWSNQRGYCRINSNNAGEWLAVHGAAA